MALSPEQPPQPSLSGGQEGAKNPSVGYPGDKMMTTLNDPQANAQTDNNPDEASTREGPDKGNSLIETLSPYETHNEWNVVNRRKPKTKYRNERHLRKLINLEQIFEETPYFVKMFNIKFPGVDINEGLNVIKADNEIKAKVGNLRKIVKAGKSTLLVETESENQSNKLLSLKQIADVPVVVEAHRTLNQVKGVIKSKAMGMNTVEELVDKLKDQGVSSIQRIKIKRNGEEIQTDTYIVNFHKHTIPKVLRITDWHYEAVQEYIHQPQQCYNCQRFGHVAKYCRRTNKTCVRCGTEGHTKEECVNAISCFHCKCSHYANDKSCDKYKIEKEIIATQQREKTSRTEATEIVLAKIPQGEKLYSTVATRKTTLENQNEKRQDQEQTTPPQQQAIPAEMQEQKGKEQVKEKEKSPTGKANNERKRGREEQEQSCRASKKTVEHEAKRKITENPAAKEKSETSSKSVDERMKQTVAMYVAKRTEKSTQNEHSSNKNARETKIRSSETGHGEEAENKEAKRSKNEVAALSQRSGSRTQRDTKRVQETPTTPHNTQATSTIQVLIGNKPHVP